jgi:BirA family biotin operon repressor/biotin-[acetyl-CoA-carboxylase] ligase
MYIKIIKLNTISSTNDYALGLASRGAKEITVVKASHQTSGKGRRGRNWVSAPNKGIYASFIFTPANSLTQIYYLPLLLALAAARTLKNILPLTIKLPNDVFSGSKKIAGMLVEAKVTGKKADFVVAGIGININSEKEELPAQATSLYLERGIKYNMEELFDRLVKEVIIIYKEFIAGNINPLLREVFLYQETKSLKKIKAEILKNRGSEEIVHILP